MIESGTNFLQMGGKVYFMKGALLCRFNDNILQICYTLARIIIIGLETLCEIMQHKPYVFPDHSKPYKSSSLLYYIIYRVMNQLSTTNTCSHAASVSK